MCVSVTNTISASVSWTSCCRCPKFVIRPPTLNSTTRSVGGPCRARLAGSLLFISFSFPCCIFIVTPLPADLGLLPPVRLLPPAGERGGARQFLPSASPVPTLLWFCLLFFPSSPPLAEQLLPRLPRCEGEGGLLMLLLRRDMDRGGGDAMELLLRFRGGGGRGEGVGGVRGGGRGSRGVMAFSYTPPPLPPLIPFPPPPLPLLLSSSPMLLPISSPPPPPV